MKRIGAVFLVLVFIAASPVLADESDDKVISGTVVSLDWAGYILTVRYVDPQTDNLDEISLRAAGDSGFTRGPQAISFSDIRQGDEVSVTYYGDDFSGLKIRSLTDSSSPKNKVFSSEPYSTEPYGSP